MQRPCQPPLPSSPQPFVVAKASLGAKPRCQMPYRVTHSSLCVSRQFRAQTFVPHFIHLTRPQYPQTSQNDLLGYVSWQVPNASRYDNGGRANNLRNSSSDGISGTRDTSRASLSPVCGAGGCLFAGGKTGGRSTSVIATSLSCVPCLGVEAAVSFLPPPGRFVALEDGFDSRACRAR
jgi:hypothetical protein